MQHKAFKRVLALLLAACMLLPLLPTTLFAQEADDAQSLSSGTDAATEDAAVQLGTYTEPAPAEEAAEPAEEAPADGEAAASAETAVTETRSAATRATDPNHVGPANEGRANAGDVTLTADRIEDGRTVSTTYVLIGTAQQLQALDYYPAVTQSMTQNYSSVNAALEAARYDVTGPIWRLSQTRSSAVSDWVTTSAELVYPGDADLRADVALPGGGTKDFSGYSLYGVNGYIDGPTALTGSDQGRSIGTQYDYNGGVYPTPDTRTYYVGGTLDAYDESITSYSSGAHDLGKYSPQGYYVVFRDIDMQNVAWEPLMFYGHMLGVNGQMLEPGETLVGAVEKINFSARSSDYTNENGSGAYHNLIQPEIQHVRVNVGSNTKLNINKYLGVGFFATISSARPGVSDFTSANVQAQVRNLKLVDLSVINNSGGVEKDETLVSLLTGFLGSGVGLVLDGLLTVLLGKTTDFDDALNDLLDARRKDPTNQATGGFVGKINGDVLIENCDLETVTVRSSYSYCGGFVGYSSGIVEYDALSGIANGLLNLLSNLLNVVPGVGLGDLIIIVKQILPLNNLIPVGYLNPRVTDCDITALSGTIGTLTETIEDDGLNQPVTQDAAYAGGFIGCKIATVMIGCAIHDSTYTVTATNFAGGFAGLARDAVIQELLTDLGIDLSLMKTIAERLADANVNLQSVQVRCDLTNCNVTVNGANYLGGFNGAMTNAYCINNTVDCAGNALTVTGTGDCVGGFAGLATLGFSMSLGSGTVNESLLSTLNKVLTSLLSSYGSSLLNLMGVGQSEILGLQFDYGQVSGVGSEAVITGNDYVGGLVGKGDALIIAGAVEDELMKVTYIADGDLTARDLFPDTSAGAGFTVSYLTPTGVTTPAAQTGVAFGSSVVLPADPGNAPSGYSFVGWVTNDYTNSDAEPANVYPATVPAQGNTPAVESSYVVTRDVTFRALYEKPGQFVYVLVTDGPGDLSASNAANNLYNDYVITYGALDDDTHTLVLLTGLANDDASYESASSGGATTLADTGATDATRAVLTGFTLSNVDDLYAFTVESRGGSDMYSIRNVSTGKYLRVNVSLSSSYLSANSTYLAGSCKWQMLYSTAALNTTVKSDTAGAKGYIGYNVGGYFQVAPPSQSDDTATLKIKDVYLWRKTMDGPYYDTFTHGAGAGVTVAGGTDFDYVNVKGLKTVTGRKCVGGLVGLADTASVSSLVGDTAGLAKYEIFEFSNIRANRNETKNGQPWRGQSSGLTVTGSDYYVGGGIGLAVGGTVGFYEKEVTVSGQTQTQIVDGPVTIDRLVRVQGFNCVGGFAGCVGPGALLGTGGLDVRLAGFDLITANNLLSVADGMETRLRHVTVTGVPAGYTVEVTGTNGAGETAVFTAGGFFGRSNSTNAYECHAVQVQSVIARDANGRAGGFIGVSEVGGLASMDDAQGTQIKGLISADNLLNTIGYLIPEYVCVDVSFTDSGFVQGAWAGGFAADFQSGTVDNYEKGAGDYYAVYNVDHVTGTRYAGGFGAKVYSGALADAGGGISILGSIGVNIDASDLLSVVNAYVPIIRYAGVKSDLSTKQADISGLTNAQRAAINGFIVTCSGADPDDARSGAAGGFIGYGSGVQVSCSDVTLLRHTTVTPPAELESEVADGTYYYKTTGDGSSAYAITSTRYAAGYIAYMDVGSSASLGGGLNVINAISLNDVLGALSVVVSTIEHSDVYGAPGGFSVISVWNEAASGEPVNYSGRAGGFAGWVRGGHIQDSSSYLFAYIIGKIAAGGYVGEIEPGSVADALGSTSVLGGLVESPSTLLSLAQDFVPSIRNSVTTCIPCGGAVRADAPATATVQRGMAGGYVGHNNGGQIWGNNTKPWKPALEYDENNHVTNNSLNAPYAGDTSLCKAVRILSVYGYEYGGGFTGLMDAASTASTGSLSLLWGLIKASNVLGALSIVYPTEENTAVYGPLYEMDYQTWNSWVDYVGIYGGYGLGMQKVADQEALDAILGDYLYGYHVAAGRSAFSTAANAVKGGYAGGYVGAMRTGTVTNGQAYNPKQVRAMHAAGGFAGEMAAGGAAELGSASLLGLNLDLTSLVSALQVFVPCIKNSSVHGYQSGLTVCATGDATTRANDDAHRCGDAGGYVGAVCGGQIWGDQTVDSLGNALPTDGCQVYNLKKVQGSRHAGGFAGSIRSGSAADANTNTSNGLFQGILDSVISTPTNLATVLNATLSTVRKAGVNVADPAWGYTVEGVSGLLPECAGGFAGSVTGAVLGERNNAAAAVTAANLRGVAAREYAGGFVGLADADAAASAAESSNTNVLSLLGLGRTNVLDAFRPYFYYASVSGVTEGFTVFSTEEDARGVMSAKHYTGCAGGFGGAVLNGTVEHSSVSSLSAVKALNYTGGFIGYTGKSGVLNADEVSTQGLIQELLLANASIGNVVGSTVTDCSVTGIADGYTVDSEGGSLPVAGGFIGFGDLAQIGQAANDPDCTASNLKYVTSDEIAGGFIGRTALAYLVDAEVGGQLTTLIVGVVNALLTYLALPQAEQTGLIRINLSEILGISGLSTLTLNVLSDDDLLYVELLGLKIGVSLANNGNAAQVRLGDSSVTLPVTNGQVSGSDLEDKAEEANLRVQLFRTNRTRVENCTVTGIAALGGYDVFGGGADQKNDGSSVNGAAGGFVGVNEESTFRDCAAVQCDVVRGTADKVGPFSGLIISTSVYDRQSAANIEGTGNSYNGTAHTPGSYSAALQDPAGSTAKVKLLADTELTPNPETMVTPTADMQNPCKSTVDLTLYKVWDDPWQQNSSRPTVRFTIHQRETVNGTTTDTAFTQTVELTPADANTFTSLVWEKKITGLPATEDVNGTLHYYSYYVTEAATDGYVSDVAYADTDAADKLSFLIDGTLGYVAKLTNLAILDQVVVVDYGLPVKVHAADYLEEIGKLAAGSLQIQRIFSDVLDATIYVRDGDPAAADPQASGNAALNAAFSGVYGNLKLLVDGDEFRLLEYTPKNMQMTAPESVVLRLLATGASAYRYTRVTFVPATTMYYEDDFITFNAGSVTYKPGEGENPTTPAPTAISWTPAGTVTVSNQQEDRPGGDIYDADSIYGYDSHYESCAQYSLGGAMQVTVGKPADNYDTVTWPTASFTFTGSGFDLISVTDATTGYMNVEVIGTTADGTPVHKKWNVDTFFGCTRSQSGFVRYVLSWVGSGNEGRWVVVKTVFSELSAVPQTDPDGYEIRANFPAADAVGQEGECFAVYRENYVWAPSANGLTLYQIPVVSSEDRLSYGTYTVTLTPMYAPFFDHNKDDHNDSYTLYVDAVRIYSPAQGLDASYYQQDHEAWPQFIQMRNLLLTQEAFSSINSTVPGAVFMDGLDKNGAISDYEPIGPNNEIYLKPGQAVAFSLQCADEGNIDRVHVSFKKVSGTGQGEAAFTNGTDILATIRISTATERYYDITRAVVWNDATHRSGVIVIRNNQDTGDIILSMRNLKVTYKTAPTQTVQVVTDPNTGRTAAAILRAMSLQPVLLDEDVAFSGVNVSLGSDLALHFYVPQTLLDGAENACVLFTVRDETGAHTVTCSSYTLREVDGVVCRRYSYCGIAAADMGDTVEARLFFTRDGTDVMGKELSYSVQRYALQLLSTTNDAALKTLLVDMLRYGAKAQAYFEPDEVPADAVLSEAQLALGTQGEPALVNQSEWIGNQYATAHFAAWSLSLRSRISINYYMDLSGCAEAPEELCLVLRYTDRNGELRELRLDGADFVLRQVDGSSLYFASFDALEAAQMRTVVYAELRRSADDVRVSETLGYSILSYASIQAGSEDAALSELVKAMIRYGDAAEAYFSES